MASRLGLDERVRIEAGIRADESFEAIAAALGRHRSTVAREVGAGGGRDAYRAVQAQAGAQSRARRPKVPKLARLPGLAETVAAKLAQRWSPHAIAAWLRAQAGEIGCAAETIYRALYANAARAGLAAGPWKLLPSARRRRRARRRAEQAKRNQLGDITLVHARPAGAAERTEAGHWEGDLIKGAYNRSGVVTLVERVSRYTILGDLPEGCGAESVLACLLEAFARVPAQLRRSLCWDQGREMAEWESVADGLGVPVYFCEPHSPWQRPSNENGNRLLRRWLPKGTDLSRYSQHDLDEIAVNLNTMPRRLHDWTSADEQYRNLF